MRLLSKLLNIGAIAALTALTGCGTPPVAEVDAAKIRTIHTVTVIYPGKTVYGGARAQVPAAAGGLLGIALNSLTSANTAKENARSLDDLVTAKLGDTKLNRRFTDGIEAALRAHGYVVKEADASAPTLPTFSMDDHFDWHASGPAYRDSDAVLLIRVTPMYSSNGPMSAYTRFVRGEIVMFTADTHEAVFRQRVYWMKTIDPYTYHFMQDIEADLPRAISGLDESMMAQVDLFDKSLSSDAH
ncbi:hypothetical protein [Paraburkholderia rhizosphaerae]|uniref:Lipoprotein n=1 Tax=Paraburkholderia rhizosphaerae TaxID=480658 RepID=A0A4R8LYD9_9BURK|nr:hypothetical protein [Paraburkholderia rhizosphaerae]TDY52236.1 hypothetical protein BX592_105120 [Paraburkholderia rhizosphaerae]